MTDTPFTDKHASPWVPEPNTDWVPAYMVRELERELAASQAEVERLKEALKSCWHAANTYDGNYARACDNVELIVRNALISLTPDKNHQ
jgi:uncharacterized small protein (DUF1192 family)